MTDLAISAPNLAAFAPTNWKELVQYADMMARSKSVPECYRGDPAAVIQSVQMAAELGIGPGQALDSIANIDGKLRIWGDSPLGLCRASGKLEWIKEQNNFYAPAGEEATWKEPPVETWWARCTIKRRGDAEETTQLYTYGDALRAGLWGRESRSGKPMPWTTNPKRLMKYRARGFLLRDLFPDVLKGIAIAEEFDEPRNVTASAPRATGNESLREKMAGAMGAAGIVKDPPAPPPPPVDESIPDFEAMVVAQVRETLESTAFDRGMPESAYRAVVADTLGERRLTKATALEVWRAIRAWVAPEPVDEPEATPTTEEPELF
jgi:hypothetical protein